MDYDHFIPFGWNIDGISYLESRSRLGNNCNILNNKMECQICYLKYTPKLRKKFTCLKCFKSACSTCIYQHMLERVGYFTCLFCPEELKIADVRDFICTSRIKRLEKCELEYYFELEIGMLEETRIALQEERYLFEAEMMMRWLRRNEDIEGFTEEQFHQALVDIGFLKKTTSHIFQTCPKCDAIAVASECNSCGAKICDVCLQEKTSDHFCDEGTLETIKHIKTVCETCPKCHVLIEKESGGCDQMFCTKCNTTFSWTTKRIVTKGEIHHNPHFYDWQRQNRLDSRHPLDNPCEGPFLVKCHDELNKENLKFKLQIEEVVQKGNYLLFVQRKLTHAIETILKIQEMDEQTKHKFRENFINKRFNLKQWKMRFKQHIKSLRRNEEIKTLLLVCLDSLYDIVNNSDANEEMLENLFNFSTSQLKAIQKLYGRTMNYIIGPGNLILPYMI